MALNFIPKLQYGNLTTTGDITSASAIVTNIPSTAALRTNMKAVGTGIPVGAKILTIDSATQVTLDVNATATTAGVSIEFYDEFTFTYPPVQDAPEALKAVTKTDAAESGTRQVAYKYTEATRNPVFRFLTDADITALQYFFDNHGKLGKEFKWFNHATETPFTVYELADFNFDPKRILPKNGSFLYEVDLKFRRVF